MSTRRALAFSYLDRYASLGLFVVSSMIIARLLTPTQVGIYSITMVMIGFISPFRDFGASQYLINEKELTTDRIRAVWAIQLGLSVLLALVIFSLRGVAADFYREPLIRDIMVVLALNSLVIPFGALTSAWLTRELRFDRLAIVRFSGNLAGSSTSVYLAWQGHGPISLAYGALATTLISALAATYFRPSHFPWLPGLRELRRVAGFGSAISGITLLNIAYTGTAELILGRLQGMHATGLFGRAQGLVLLFERLLMDSVHSVALPAFSKLRKEDQEVGGAFIHSIAMIAVLGWTLLTYLALMAYPMITLLYGDQWKESVDLARLLCLGMDCMLLTALSPALLIAVGKRWVALQLNLVNLVVQAAFCLVGALTSLEALGWAIVAASVLLSLIWLHVTQRIVGFRRRALLGALARSFLVAAAALVGPLLTVAYFGLRPDNVLPPLILSGLGLAAGFLTAAWRLRHPVWTEILQLLDGALARFKQA